MLCVACSVAHPLHCAVGLQIGNKELFHLEAFIAKAMLLLKSNATVWALPPAAAASTGT